MKTRKIILIVVILLAASLFFALDVNQYLTLEHAKLKQQQLDSWYLNNPALVIGGYFLVYVVITAVSLPGAAIMTLVGGAIFGLVTGTIIISFASTIGATLAFLIARYLLGETVNRKFGGFAYYRNHTTFPAIDRFNTFLYASPQ